MRAFGAHRARIAGTTLLMLAILVLAFAPGSANAYWSSTGSGSAVATTGTLASPVDVTVPGTALAQVDVGWTAGAAGPRPDGYYVTRYDASTPQTAVAACGSSPVALVQDVTCTDVGVPDGQYRYVVTAVYRSWTAVSSRSGTVAVQNPAALAFTTQPTTVTAGAPITPTVTVALRTATGDPAAMSGVPVTLAIGTNPAGGTLTGSTTQNTNADGVVSFAGLSIDQPGAGYTLTATSPGLSAATSASFTVAAPPLLGAAASYSVLGGTAVVGDPVTTVSGDVGVSPGTAVTGFGPGNVGGDIHAGDASAAAAQTAFGHAYDTLAGLPAGTELAGEAGGLTLTPGVYHSTAALAVTGTLILDARGDPDAIFVFQAGAAFNTAAASRVTLINGAQASNVFWVVTGAAGAGANSFLSGTILSRGAVTLGAGTTLIGRALSRGTVTLAANTIRFNQALPPTMTIDGGAAAVTKDVTPTITGTTNAPASSPVTVSVAGQTLNTTVAAGGTWAVTATALAAATDNIVAKVRAPSGDGASASQMLTVEVNPPPVDLGAAGTFSVLAGTGVTNVGTTSLSGDLGVSPMGAAVGFGPLGGTVGGTTHVGDTAAANAHSDLVTAIDDALSRPPHTEIAGDLGGRTFHAGVRHSAAAIGVTGTVTLDGEGDPNAVFIFQVDAAFNTTAASHVNLINGAQADNVFWVVTGAAGTGANSSLAGALLAKGAITLGAGTALTGQALSLGTVTLSQNTLTGVAPAPVTP